MENLEDDSAAVEQTIAIFQKSRDKLAMDTATIKQHYCFVTQSITLMEEQGIELSKAL